MIKIYSYDFRGVFDENDIKRYENLISDERREKLPNYLKKEDALRSLYSELILRYVLKKEYHLNNCDIEFEKNSYGKPYLKNRSDIYFNISHSEDRVICAFSNREIGVDVEKVKEIDFSIGDYVFSEKEKLYFDTLDKYEKEKYFFKVWTSKESYIKAKGKGLSIKMKTFDIDKLEESDFKIRYFNDNEYYTAVCGKFEKLELTNVSKTDIVSVF